MGVFMCGSRRPAGCSAHFQLLNSITGSKAAMPVTRQLCAKYDVQVVGGGEKKRKNRRATEKH